MGELTLSPAIRGIASAIRGSCFGYTTGVLHRHFAICGENWRCLDFQNSL
jgi:hypothetical protein